jgi:hypothetical protein
MKNPIAFTVATLIVLLAAGLIFYFYGLPMLTASSMGCHYGGGTKSFGCSSSFGTFMTFLGGAVVIAIAAIWNRFGRY